MSIPGSAAPFLLARQERYRIERSLRFNASDSAHLVATFGTPTDQDVFTLSMWVKRSALGSTQHLFGVSTNHSFGFTSGDALNLTFGGSTALTTTALFRDPSAWYQIMWVQNGTAHTLYVNGTSVGTATATSNTFNTAVAHQIGAGNTANFFNGYLADIHFIDGQALDPTSFGEFDTNGVWQPKPCTGSYGTNGFHLPFSDNSTAAALGTDASGNSNTWTVNNISVAAGSGNDSLVDTPTSYGTDTGAGGEVRGNYCTWNPLEQYSAANVTLSNGNLFVQSTLSFSSPGGTISTATSGKWYWEVSIPIVVAGGAAVVGFKRPGVKAIDYPGANLGSYGYRSTAIKQENGNGGVSYGATWTTSDIIGVAVDADAGTATFYKNGVSQGVAFTGLSGGFTPHVGGLNSVDNLTFALNTGARPFAYPAPSGYKALCTTNLPEPQTITTSGSYTGNGVADGPFVYLNGVPTAMTVNGNAVTFGTEADKLSNGFKVRTTSATYNQNAVVYNYSITSTGDPFKRARAQSNP